MASIEILIPTFNRAEPLRRNLRWLAHLIRGEALEGVFRLLVSDNSSTDRTWEVLSEHRSLSDSPTALEIFRQDQNIGLERNAIFLLERASAPFVMYLGDDDYLPPGYLTYVARRVAEDPELGTLVPGVARFYRDGRVVATRLEAFDCRCERGSFRSALKISHLGHQLSGVVLRREGMLDRYVEDSRLRNIYPFIFFVAFNALRGTACYAPSFKVLVSEGNRKDWGYDESGLLTEIVRNFTILYPHSIIRRALLNCVFIWKQNWRLSISGNPRHVIAAIGHLWRSEYVDPLTKTALLPLVGTVGARFLARKVIAAFRGEPRSRAALEADAAGAEHARRLGEI